MTAGSRDDCKATQIKCYNGTSSSGLGKTRRAMKKPERATPGKAVLQYASSLQSESRPSEHHQKTPIHRGLGLTSP